MSTESGHKAQECGAIVSRYGRVLVPKDNGCGYLRVTLGGRAWMIHRLVWQHFRGPIPPGYQINHIDGNKSNNAIGNLELVTPSENARHAWGMKRRAAGKRKRLTRCQAERIRELGSTGFPRRMVKDMFGVRLACIRHIQNGRNHVV